MPYENRSPKYQFCEQKVYPKCEFATFSRLQGRLRAKNEKRKKSEEANAVFVNFFGRFRIVPLVVLLLQSLLSMIH